MSHKTVAAAFVCSALLLSACSKKPYFPEEYQVKNYTDGEISAFGLNIAPADEMGDWVVEWLADVNDGDGFQYFIYADPDSWDVYLYDSEKQADIQRLTNDDVAVEYADSTLNVYVTAGEETSIEAEEEEKWILHFTAQPFGAWPSKIKLYWNGYEISGEGF